MADREALRCCACAVAELEQELLLVLDGAEAHARPVAPLPAQLHEGGALVVRERVRVQVRSVEEGPGARTAQPARLAYVRFTPWGKYAEEFLFISKRKNKYVEMWEDWYCKQSDEFKKKLDPKYYVG